MSARSTEPASPSDDEANVASSEPTPDAVSSPELDAARAMIAIGDHRGARAQLEAVPEDAPQDVKQAASVLLTMLSPDPVALIVAGVTLVLAIVILIAVV